MDSAIPIPKLNDGYLKLQLESQKSSVLLLEHIQEVLVMPVEQITFMPSMPEYVLGLMNRHSKVLWVVDLPQMLGLQSLEQNIQQYHIAIIRVEHIPLGLAVQKVLGVMRLTSEEIEVPPNNQIPNLTPYLRGCVSEQEGRLLVLDTKAIVDAVSS